MKDINSATKLQAVCSLPELKRLVHDQTNGSNLELHATPNVRPTAAQTVQITRVTRPIHSESFQLLKMATEIAEEFVKVHPPVNQNCRLSTTARALAQTDRAPEPPAPALQNLKAASD